MNKITLSLLLTILAACAQPTNCKAAEDLDSCQIVVAEDASEVENLAALEVRRYVYLRTGELLKIIESDGKLPEKSDLIVISTKERNLARQLGEAHAELATPVNALSSQQYIVKSLDLSGHKAVWIAGGDPVGTLYGSYRFIETLGVRFFLHGDTIPDGKIALKLEDIDEVGKPLFELRGIQPFHNFPVGPTLWDRDNYLAVIEQLAKMRMNFIGFHTYPTILPWYKYPAPDLWWGFKEDINSDGTVKASPGATYDVNTISGMNIMGTDRYSYGASQLFTKNLYASDLYQDFMPTPQTDAERNAVYNRSGQLYNQAFTLANSLGVKTCLGSELPRFPDKPFLPVALRDKIKKQGRDPEDKRVLQEAYEGVFERIKRMHPLDYYWLWGPENWMWNNIPSPVVDATVAHLQVAMEAAKAVDVPFTLGTSGWVLGAPQDKRLFDKALDEGMFVSSINRALGAEQVDPAYKLITDRPKWAIPWIEDDLAMNSPQLWVGRIRKDAVDARDYGCNGLLGIHWRTRIIGPTVSALAQAGWGQQETPVAAAGKNSNEEKYPVTFDGGNTASFAQTIQGAGIQPVYQTVRYGDMDYEITLPNGDYKVTFQMVEPAYNASSVRKFSIQLNGNPVVDRLDIFAEVGKNTAFDTTVEHVSVNDGNMRIQFISHTDFACIAGIVIEEHSENMAPDAQPVLIKINCGGPASHGYIPDVEIKQKESRYLAADDFYLDWAGQQFGPECAQEIADIFVQLDCNIPKVSSWGPGPGGIKSKPYEENLFTFVDELAAIQSQIKGTGNRDRFAYWLTEFRYLRSMAKVAGLHHSLQAVMSKLTKEENADAKQQIAREEALPLRQSLIEEWGKMMTLKLSSITTTGGIGDAINLEDENRIAQSIPEFADKTLSEVLGEPLPAMPQDYRGPARIFVPALRSLLGKAEDLHLKVLVMGSSQPASVMLYWRPLGDGEWQQIPAKHDARSVYRVTLPAERIKGDFEYCFKAVTDSGIELRFPATAPELNQTVVVWQ